MSITIRDVARLSGYSLTTISKVMNGSTSVRPRTRDDILRAVDELGYRPNAFARSLRSGRSGVIGLAVPTVRSPYYAEVAALIIEVARSLGARVVIEQTHLQRKPELAVAAHGSRLVDGVIFSPLLNNSSDIQLYDAALPLVSLDETSGDGVDAISINNLEASRMATEHLLAIGCRRIAVLGLGATPPQRTTGRRRLLGYTEALQAAGVPFRQELLVGREDAWNREGGSVAMSALLDAGTPFDAVLGLNDALALGGLHAARMRGVRVPDDVAFIGIDGVDETLFGYPPLSTVDGGKNEIARRSVELLLDRLGGDQSEPRIRYADHRLVIRESSRR